MREQGWRFAAALVAILIPDHCWAQDISASGDELTGRAARLVLIVAPDYPKDAAARGEGATIDVFARVKTDGTLADWKLPDTKELQPFTSATREVLPFWVVMPRIDEATCRSREDDFQVRVWFEIVEGKPKISVSQAAQPREEYQAKVQENAKLMRPKMKKRLVFPVEAIRKGIEEATLAVVMRVEKSGAVTGVEVRPGLHRDWFEPSIVTTVSQWEFEFLRDFPADKSHLCAELLVDFRLTDSRIQQEMSEPRLPRRVQ
jgi:outer membrane biosynthesis protein TonB